MPPAVVAFVVTAALAFAIVALGRRAQSPLERAALLARSGRIAAAESLYFEALRKEPSARVALELVDQHQHAVIASRKRPQDPTSTRSAGDYEIAEHPVDEATLDAFLESLPADVAIVARFWNGVLHGGAPPEQREAIEEGARREPPVPWHHHVLGREARHRGDGPGAAVHFEQEGLVNAERASDIDLALELWMDLGAWDHVEERLRDPRVERAAAPATKYRLAVRRRDFRAAARWLALSFRPRLVAAHLAMSGVSALAWGFFCARLGKLGERPWRRLPLYVVAFVLGVASIAPTVALIAVEEATLSLVETGDAARDILFFVFGVGLREEASKLLLFVPLLYALRRFGDKLDVLVCGALVGLGFAAEENLDYLASGDLAVGLGRFLTANFLHMAMTGILASALAAFVADPEKHASDFTRATLMVVGLHGAYDFLLSHEEFGGGYFAMGVFVLLARFFLDAVDDARRRTDRGLTILQAFVIAVSVVVAITFVYATNTVGPAQALPIMASGLLGVAVIMLVFVRSLERM